jgi:hypothetical protein
MKISEQDLERYLLDLSNSYAEDSNQKQSNLENAYAQGVRETVSHVFALLNGSVSVAYMKEEK